MYMKKHPRFALISYYAKSSKVSKLKESRHEVNLEDEGSEEEWVPLFITFHV